MPNEINHRRSRFLETASILMAGADPTSATYEDALSSPIVEVQLTPDAGMNRAIKTNNNRYPADVLAELSILVRNVRATSPDSALAAIADAKIGRSIALGGNDNTLMQGAS
jgi:type IV secretory pathway TrbF-like protein